ncbi:hypothetical protein DNH61_05890 [Paenibacillus sambharensis]|uniref:Uncharacterized protein n=1 Tax=Paenibacillus sambharensis TaxID=1803190 RepID=A0A2W1L957_9BACL|nr:DUF6157 family protein [Paenibacillus sambharensis]PZD96728.1 hypothetical protein DNH61_05890 [Paenibacillus sambharensis]
MTDNNYYGTFIQVADDCPVTAAEVPKTKGSARTVAVMQYDMIVNYPYQYTQEDILFEIFAARTGIAEGNQSSEREKFFSKGQPCLRTSPLAKRYGWGIHFDDQGKAALYAVESADYERLKHTPGIKQVKAMRSSRG